MRKFGFHSITETSFYVFASESSIDFFCYNLSLKDEIFCISYRDSFNRKKKEKKDKELQSSVSRSIPDEITNKTDERNSRKSNLMPFPTLAQCLFFFPETLESHAQMVSSSFNLMRISGNDYD